MLFCDSGGNLSVAVGPIGRNAEASGSLNKRATMYSYSRTRGLFGGASLEGGVIFERGDANAKAYASQVADSDEYFSGEIKARMILSGRVAPPSFARMLVAAIERRTGAAMDESWVHDQPDDFEETRNRGYSFGSDHAAQGSDARSGSRYSDKKSPRSRKDEYGFSDRVPYGDREEVYGAGSGNSSATKGSRLRGYSLGSFGRKNSISSKGGISPAARRMRSNTTNSAYRYRDEERDEGEDGRERGSNGSRPVRRSSQRDFDDDEYEIPPSPSSTTSTSSRTQRFTDFMKRPVIPQRKSTSDARPGAFSSPLGGRSRSQSKSQLGFSTSSRTSGRGFDDHREEDEHDVRQDMSDNARTDYFSKPDRSSRFERRFSPTASDDEDSANNEMRARTRSRSPSPSSPFGDNFSSTFDFAAASGGGKKGSKYMSTESRSRSPSPDSHPRSNASAPRSPAGRLGQAVGKFRPSSVTAKPTVKRSSTAPLPSSRGGSGRNRAEQAYNSYADRVDSEEDDDAFYPGRANAASDRDGEDDFLGGGRKGSATSNPFGDEAASPTARTSAGHPSGLPSAAKQGGFFGKKDRRDLLDSLDSDEDQQHTSSSYEPVQPRHRLDIYHPPTSSEDDDDDDDGAAYRRRQYSSTGKPRSIRSIDSSQEFTFGDRAHKLVVNDLRGEDVEHPPFLETNTRTASYSQASSRAKEYVQAVYDFEAGQEGDLAFRIGEVIEVLKKDDPDWWTGRIGLKEGIIPVNRTKPYKA